MLPKNKSIPLLFIPLLVVIYRLITQISFRPLREISLDLGYCALILLFISLAITPLKNLLPKKLGYLLPLKYRREIGIACFIYSVGHLIFYFLDIFVPATIIENFGKPFILYGLFAWAVLLLMTLTSNDKSIKKLGKKKWKNIHRLVYLIIIPLFIHVSQKEKGDITNALIWFSPIIVLEALRVGSFAMKKFSKPKSAKSANSTKV